MSDHEPVKLELPALLAEQRAYYRARAAEYDEWFYRQGRYDHGPALNAQWAAEIEQVRAELRQLRGVEQALELACGTGIWTQELISLAQHVTALDSSAEMISLNRSRLGNHRAIYQLVDLFNWHPREEADLVFMGFWLSHVPHELLTDFLKTVRKSVRTGGRLFLVDSCAASTSEDSRHPTQSLADELQIRTLNDGREFRIIKTFYKPIFLEKILRDAGFTPCVQTTEHYFIYATATAQ